MSDNGNFDFDAEEMVARAGFYSRDESPFEALILVDNDASWPYDNKVIIGADHEALVSPGRAWARARGGSYRIADVEVLPDQDEA